MLSYYAMLEYIYCKEAGASLCLIPTCFTGTWEPLFGGPNLFTSKTVDGCFWVVEGDRTKNQNVALTIFHPATSDWKLKKHTSRMP